MQFQQVIKKFGKDVFYLSVLGVVLLFHFITPAGNPHPGTEFERKFLHSNVDMMGYYKAFLYENIQRGCIECDDARIYQERAKKAIWLQEKMDASILNGFNQPLEKAWMMQMSDSLIRLSLRYESEQKPVFQEMLSNIDTITSWPLTDENKRFVLELLRAEVMYTTLAVLNTINDMLKPPISCFTYFLAAIPEKSVIAPGERFAANIWLMFRPISYVMPLQQEILVDGRPVQQQYGTGYFTRTYNSPGHKFYTVEYKLTDPLTRNISSFKRTFDLFVTDTTQTTRSPNRIIE